MLPPHLTGLSPSSRSRANLVHRLARAEQHVLDGDRRLRQQRRFIGDLVRRDLDIASATMDLRNYEKLQALFVADRNALANELARTPAA